MQGHARGQGGGLPPQHNEEVHNAPGRHLRPVRCAQWWCRGQSHVHTVEIGRAQGDTGGIEPEGGELPGCNRENREHREDCQEVERAQETVRCQDARVGHG